MNLPSPLSVCSSNLKQVGEVRREGDSELDATGPVVEIVNAQPFEATGPPQKSRPSEVDEIVLNLEPPRRVEQVGIGEIASERGVVVTQRRTEQHRSRAIERHCEMREVTHI